MRKVIRFCKTYLAEVLFALVAVLCVAAVIYSALCLVGFVAGGVIISALVALAYLGYWIQRLEKPTGVPSLVFRITWYAGFMMQAVTLIVCIIITQPADKAFLLSVLAFCTVAFTAMFGLMVMVATAL